MPGHSIGQRLYLPPLRHTVDGSTTGAQPVGSRGSLQRGGGGLIFLNSIGSKGPGGAAEGGMWLCQGKGVALDTAVPCGAADVCGRGPMRDAAWRCRD